MKIKLVIIIIGALLLLCVGCTSFTDAQGSGDVYYENLHAINYYDINGNDLIPDQTGNAGLVLGTNGTNTLWVAGGGVGDMTKATYDPANIAEQLVGLTAAQALTNKQITMNNNEPIYWKTLAGVPRSTINLLASDILQITNPSGSIQLLGGSINLNYNIDEEIYLWGGTKGEGRELVLYSGHSTVAATLRDSPTLNMAASYWDGGASVGWSYDIINDMVTAGATPKSQAIHSINNVPILTLINDNGTVSSTTAGNFSLTGSNNELRFYEGVNYVGFEAPALTGNQIWVLPDVDGAANEVLTTDGSGNLSWAAGGGAGANTALSNLAAVAINTSLVSDTDITDDLGTGDIRWKDIYSATLNSGLTAGDTLKLRGYDVNGVTYVDILTVTSNNTVTADLDTSVTIGGQYIYRATGTDIPVTDGGTGLSVVADGSILATNAADTLSAITWHAAGTKVLTNTSGTISWETAAAGMVNPMTTLGDIIYEDATPAPARLAGDTTNARTFLTSLSIVGVAQAPAWDTLTSADVGLGSVENTALSTWAGSANIVTVGTIGSGTWNGGVIPANYGGTGVANNVASTLTISGTFATTLTVTNVTTLTLPVTGTLATLAGTEELDNKTLDASVTKGTWTTSGTWTLPSFVTSDAATIEIGAAGVIKSGATNADTLLIAANDTTFITLTTGVTDTMDIASSATIGGAYIYRAGGTDIPVADGGTGLSAIADGSILATNAADTLSAITWHAAGTKILTNTSGTISWESNTGLVNPMTTLGDIIYEDATPAPARLAGDTTDTKKFLSTLSIAGVAQAPTWGTIAIGDLPTITPAKGGTGVVNGANNTITFTGNFTLGLTLSNNTSVTLPTSGTLMTTSDNAASATYASNATITNASTNATMYPVWVTANTGNLPLKVTSGNLTYNPSTGVLTATTFSGALSGNASTVTGLSVTAGKTLTVTDSATIATNSITLAGGEVVTFTAVNALTFTTTGATSITLPTSGTLATLAGAETFTGKVSYNGLVITADTGAITTGSWHGTAIAPEHGGTGVANNAASTITITGNYSLGLTLTNNTSVTLPTTGTLSTLAGTEELDNKTLDSSVAKGTWTTSGTWTLPAFTLAGAVAGGDQTFTNVGDMTFATGSILASGSSNGNTLLVKSNDTTFLTFTTNATDTLDIGTTATIGSAYIYRAAGTDIPPADGGTGVSNGSNNTITFTGNYTLGLTLSNNTAITLPTSGTLATIAGAETFTGKVSYNGLVVTANTGVITTGTWNGTIVTGQYGGTGVANTGKTITLGGNFTTSGAFTTTLTVTNNTNVTLPTTGTLATLAGAETFTGKVSYNGLVVTANTGAITTGSWHGTTIPPEHGGTGVANNAASTLTISGNYATTFTVTNTTSLTLPTTGTLATLAGAETFTNKTLTQPIIQIALTAGENIAAYDACYVKSDGKAWKAKGNSSTTMPALIIAQAAVNVNNSGNFMGYGYITNAGWAFTPGAYLYVSEATGGLVTSTQPSTSGNQVQVVAIAVTATQIAWNPSPIVMELK